MSLKIMDKLGKIIGILKDEDTQPTLSVQEECKCESTECELEKRKREEQKEKEGKE